MSRLRGALLLLQITAMGVMIGPSAFAKGGGGNIPSTLLDVANTRVELADGEVYSLYGQVVFKKDGLPYLKVDLKKEAWLASNRRQADPYYLLAGDEDVWHKYEGVRVQYLCFAAGVIRNGYFGPEYRLLLKPINESPEDSMLSTSPHRP
jgi:hypothetical protein